MPSNQDSETIDLAIAEVVGKWMELPESERPTPEELLQMHPDLAVGLAECLNGLKLIQSGTLGLQLDTILEVQSGETSKFPNIPDFEIHGELGRGGMGIVYDAKQLSLGRAVALKVLPIGSVDPQSIQRFQREAELVAALSHPGIVPVFSVGVHNGLHWYAMHKVDGCPLSQWFANHLMESRHQVVQEVVRIGIEAAEALDHAHQRGIIHRDVKPGNLLVENSGKVWLTDFGLARRDLDVTATVTGAMLGTPRYMSAEQIANREDLIDSRTDIYSLGATLYEMATGRPPFNAQSPLELLTQIQRDEPIAPRKIIPLIPIPLELVILKCLDKEPQRRYQSAAALADDLKAVRDHQPISAKGLPLWIVASRFIKRNQRQFNSIAASALLTALAIAVTVLLWQQNRQSQLGEVRIQSPAGLYVANIHPKSQNSAETSLVVTTPMQQSVKLPAGDYSVRMDGNSRPSQFMDLKIGSRDLVDFQYVDRREAFSEIDIYNKLALPIADGGLAVLGKDSFEVFEAGGSSRFKIPIVSLDQRFHTESGAAASQEIGDPALTFAYSTEQMFQGDFNVAHSGFARIERICQTEIDLNADGKLDLLLCAGRHAAISAMSNDGKILWTKRLEMAFESTSSVSTYPKEQMPNEAIVGITPIKDLNNDGVAELVVNTAIFDPSGYSRPGLYTLSGMDGATIATTDLPTINMQMSRNWPWTGLLRQSRHFNADNRVVRNMNHNFGQFTMRSQTSDLYNMSWGGKVNTALYVLPPLVMGEHEGRTIGVTAIGQSLHFFDLANGQSYGPPIAFSDPIGRGPSKVEFGNGAWGVIVMTGTPGNAWMSNELQLCTVGGSQVRWSTQNIGSLLDSVAGAAESRFPWAVDLDKDGEDEIIISSNVSFPWKLPVLNCYSSSDGKLRWTSDGIAGVAPIIDQAIRVNDIDNDGCYDVAVVGLSLLRTPSGNAEWEGLHLVVDFLNGRTGKRIGYRKERITGETKNDAVYEIDSVKCVGHELVCSVVYGAQEEIKLSSMTVSMDLNRLTPANCAIGLTLLEFPEEKQVSSQGDWYRRRSGEYAKPTDAAVWIPSHRFQKLFPGETLVESWTSPSGEPRLLLSGHQFLRCINPILGTTVWQKDQATQGVSSVHIVPGKDGQRDLFVSKSDTFEARPALWDAESGNVKFELSTPAMGEIKHVYFDPDMPDRTIYAFADQTYVKNGGFRKQHRDGLLLLKLDRLQNQLIWSKRCYDSINFEHDQSLPAKIIFRDINGDGIQDLITGNATESHFIVDAMDGRNGTSLWQVPLELVPDQSMLLWQCPWPMLALVPNEKDEHIVVVDEVAGNASSYQLKFIDLHTGQITARYQRPLQLEFMQAARSKYLTIDSVSPMKRDGLLGVRALLPKGSDQWTVLRLKEGPTEIIEIDQFPISGSLWTADVDENGIVDLIEVKNQNVAIHRSDTNESIGSFSIPPNMHIRGIEKIGGKSYLVGHLQDQLGHTWFEFPNGETAVHNSDGFQETSRRQIAYPRLLHYAEGTLLAGSTRELPQCVEIDFGSAQRSAAEIKTEIAMLDPYTDQRYRRSVEAVGIFQGRSFAELIILGLLSIAAIHIPIFYLIGMIRDRQWSLRRLLFGPIMVMAAIFAWRTPFLYEGKGIVLNLFAGVFLSLSLLSFLYLIRYNRWKLLAACCGLCMLMGTLMMSLSQIALTANTPSVVGYWTLSNWTLSCIAAAFQIAVPIALVPGWINFMRHKRALSG